MRSPDYTELFTGRPMPEHGGSLDYWPAPVLLLTVTHNNTTKESSIDETIVNPQDVLYNVEKLTHDLPPAGVHKATFILGPYESATSFERDEDFPRSDQDLKEIIGEPRIPFNREIFKSLVELLALPKATPWALATGSSHVKEYIHYGSTSSGTRREHASPTPERAADGSRVSHTTGYTLRIPTRGVIPMNVGLSISHNPTTRTTNTFLVGASTAQSRYLHQQLIRLANIAHHPFLLPALLCGHHEFLLRVETARLWNRLVAVETASGRGDVVSPVLLSQRRPETNEAAHADLTRAALGVAQLSSSWESGVENLTAMVGLMKNSIARLNVLGNPTEGMTETSALLEEVLDLTGQKAGVTLRDLQMIEKRVTAQMNAIYNYTAQRIATAAMRDSSAMKAIAVLTMFFLPATFMASLFAMPLLDFSAAPGAPVVQPRFWIYWVCTIPVTVAVGLIYFGYLWWQDKAKQERSDDTRDPLSHQARPDKSHTANTTDSETSSVVVVANARPSWTRPSWTSGRLNRLPRSETLELPVAHTPLGNTPVTSLRRAHTSRESFELPTMDPAKRLGTTADVSLGRSSTWARPVAHTAHTHRSPSRHRYIAVTQLRTRAFEDDHFEPSYREDSFLATSEQTVPTHRFAALEVSSARRAPDVGRDDVPQIEITGPGGTTHQDDEFSTQRGRYSDPRFEETEREEPPDAASRLDEELSAQWRRGTKRTSAL